MTKFSRSARLGPWALSLAFLCLSAAPLARADGVVDTSTIVCDPQCLENSSGYGQVTAMSGIRAGCTVGPISVSSSGSATGYWTIEDYFVESYSWADETDVETSADLYGMIYDTIEGAGGAADCSGSSSAFTEDEDGYHYGLAITNSLAY